MSYRAEWNWIDANGKTQHAPVPVSWPPGPQQREALKR